MKKEGGMKSQLLFVISICLSVSLYSQSDIFPKRVIDNLNDGIVVTYDFPRPIVQQNNIIQGTSVLRYNGFGLNDTQGEPAIPFRSDLFYIPSGFCTRVDIMETVYNDTSLILSPSIPFCLRDEMPTPIDSITPYIGFFPNNIVEYSELDNFRGVGLQRITVMPVQYNYEQHIVRSYSKIK